MQATPAGWYGKLPTLGDFASRRLGAAFVEPWDQWLSAGLANWRATDAHWLQAYLHGPSWRFLLAPGVLAPGSAPWAGVLVPSVDKVGRYFPLTVVLPLPPHAPWPASTAGWLALLHGLHRLDDLAVDAMQGDWPLETFEAALARLGGPQPPPPGPAPAALPHWALPLQQAPQAPPRSSWWWAPNAQGAPQLHRATGLPAGRHFAALLAGRLAQLGPSPDFDTFNPQAAAAAGDDHER